MICVAATQRNKHAKQTKQTEDETDISHESDNVTSLLFVCIYSNGISGITDDYLCKRPLRYVFVKEETVLLINKVLSWVIISYVMTWSFFLCGCHGSFSTTDEE